MRIPCLAAIGFAAGCLAWAGDAPRGGRIAWERDVERGLREAAEAERPAMLYFTDDK